MIKSIREAYNESFKTQQYAGFLAEIEHFFPGALDFRIAETPVFIDKAMRNKMIDTCEYIISKIQEEAFLSHTESAIPLEERVSGPEKPCQFIAFDFGICTNVDGIAEPALIELQGFPTLFCFQAFYPSILEKHFTIPSGYSQSFSDYTCESYLELLKQNIVGSNNPENVILLEIKPHEQKTRIDFYCTARYLGITIVCISELFTEDNKIFYLKEGRKIQVNRIYNRVISDELKQVQKMMDIKFDITGNWDVEWIPHPNWFYRISKYTLPLLNHPYIPETKFLSELSSIPVNLEDYVLKPLFSFAGQGVVIDLKREDLNNINDPENWILQRKMKYADCIETPDGLAKAEVRIMYIWEDRTKRPVPVTNLARLSKGKMIGTRYNKDKSWVGGTVAYFEQ
jgi:hypothetical protein